MKYDILQLNDMLVQELREIADKNGVPDLLMTEFSLMIY